MLAGSTARYTKTAHHNIHFGHAWRGVFRELIDEQRLMTDPSLLVTNPTRTDPSLAPDGRESYYVLFPTPNLDADIDWREVAPRYRDEVVRTLEARGYVGFGDGIEVEHLTTPLDWEERGMERVRAIEKAGGSLGTPGCVSYLFDRKGLIVIDAKKYPDEDAVMTAALEAGADDFQKQDDVYELTTDPTTFSAVLEAINKAGFETVEAEVKNLAKTYVDVDVEAGKKIIRLIELLDSNDDVSNVYTNANLTDAMMAE